MISALKAALPTALEIREKVMELFVKQLAVSVVPFIAFVILVVVTEEYSRKRKAIGLRIGRSVRRSFAAAAQQRWL